MEYLPNGLKMALTPGAFPLSTDSMVLAHFARLPRKARVLDLGSGCGTLGLLLCARDDHCHVTGLELSETAHLCALENIRRNGLEDRMESVRTDLRLFREKGAFDICISNPPYFTGGPAAMLKDARREDQCTLKALFAAAAGALKFGGDFFLVHRPERLAEICAAGSETGLEPKRLGLLRHKEGGSVSLVLVQCRKGAKAGLSWEELCLHHRDGSPTELYQSIYHL